MNNGMSAEISSFKTDIVNLLAEIETILGEIEERKADERRIGELGQFFNEEYRKLEGMPGDQKPEEVRQLEERIRPLQEEINRRYERFPLTKDRIGSLAGRLRNALDRAPLVPPQARELRREVERLRLLSGTVYGWQQSEADLITAKGRLTEIRECLRSEAEEVASEIGSEELPHPPVLESSAPSKDARESDELARKSMEETRRERIALWDRLAEELATIRPSTKKYTTIQNLKQKYPRFQIWSMLSEVEQRELLDKDFRPKVYAAHLVLRKAGLTSLETLRTDRKILRKLDRSRT